MTYTRTATGASTATNSRSALREALSTALRRLGRQATTGFAFCSPSLALDDVLAMANELQPDATWMGCTTAGQFNEEGVVSDGLVVMLLATDEMEQVLCFSSDRESSQGQISELCGGIREFGRQARARGKGMATTVALVDGLNGNGEKLVDRVYRELSGTAEMVGGAAGDDGKFARTLVGGGSRAESDGAVLLHFFSSRRWGVGVDHGFKPATRAMRVTRAKGNMVYEIDGRPAFEVYRDYARTKGMELDSENASPFMINNELGIVLFDELKKARAPLSVTDGALVCAAEVPQGAGVCILGGSRADLLAAAERAAREASDRLGRQSAAGVLLFDCICRGTILGDDFEREIATVSRVFPGVPLAGFLTYGEIARYPGRLDGWHNAAVVVAAIPGSN